MEKIIEKLKKFRDDRNWKQFHNEESLTMSLCIETGELIECFQWNKEIDMTNLKEEIADVFMYSLMLLSEIDWDLEKLVKRKLERSTAKYPRKIVLKCEGDSLMDFITHFRQERLWEKSDKGVSLARSIFIEAGELLVNYQWPKYYDFENVLDELADVFVYLYAMCKLYDFVPEEIIEEKIIKNGKKYPISKTA